MNICEQLVENILGTHFETFTPDDVENAKNRIIDVIGCTVIGANFPPSSMLAELVKDWGGKDESTILVHGVRAPAQNVGLVNTVMARLLDFEPIGANRLHRSATTIPAAFAVAEQKRAGGKELITALILGDDIASRIIAASGHHADMGWEPMGTVNTFAAAAIAGKLGGFNAEQMLNAFGIALDQLAGTVQSVFDGTHAFVLPQALATRAGIFSADLAARGFSGVRDALMSKYGYFALYCRDYQPEILTKELGKEFYADGAYKIYPSCGGTHGVIDCALEIISKHDIEIEDINEITLGDIPSSHTGFLGFLALPFEVRAFPPATARFNLRYNVANALLRKSVKAEHFTDEFIKDTKVAELAGKVVITDLPPSGKLTTTLDIKMKDGSEYSAIRGASSGGPIRMLSRAEIKDKFRANITTANTVSTKNAEEALNMLERLEDVDDIRQIVNLLVA
ncbi:MmgE/PrpD family protein [Chloroflexota bacterium]